VAGIAFATTLTYTITCLVMLLIIARKLPGLNLPQLGLALGKAALAAALLWLVLALLQQVHLIATVPALLRLCVLSLIGLAVYLPVLWLLRVPELALLWGMARARLPRRWQRTGGAA
jgi:peptidoglycan biosynthesis protein MviN/MurJ (putative lipid II flippase)